MQATINNFYYQDTKAVTVKNVPTIIRKEATTTILLFAGILACLVLAVNI